MAKRDKPERTESMVEPTPLRPEGLDEPVLAEKNEDTVPKARRCPLCWGGHKGTGLMNGRQGRKCYYRCQRCGHTWRYVVPLEKYGREEEGV